MHRSAPDGRRFRDFVPRRTLDVAPCVRPAYHRGAGERRRAKRITEPITTVAGLEGVVGRRPPTHHLKSIADLDPHCEAILAASPISAVATVAGDGSIGLALVGGDPGVLARADATHVDLQAAPVPDVPDGAPAALLTLVPGYGETLRVNGRWRSGAREVEVEEAFLHCAKAVIRSKLWRTDGPAVSSPVEDPRRAATSGIRRWRPG